MNNLAIIPARGGSKRLPGKNIRPFLGKPIIAYAIEAALKSDLFSEVMVSTDDEQIAAAALQCGAKVPFMRSSKNADDFTPLVSVIDEVTREYSSIGKTFQSICCLLATSPLITPDQLREAYRLLQEGSFNTIWPVVKFSYPIQKAFRIKEGKLEMFYPDQFMKRTQDFEPMYHDTGMFYFIRGGKSMMDEHRGALLIDEKYAQDIDNESDWALAEMKYKLIQQKK